MIERGPDVGEAGWTISGDPAGLGELSGQLGHLVGALEDCAAQVELARGGLRDWVGQGARGFDRLDLAQRPKWKTAADSFGAASLAISDYAHNLSAAQGRATQARALYDQGMAESAAWAASLAAARAASPHAVVVAGPDPGAQTQAEALGMLQSARADADAAARRLAGRLAPAEEAAPTSPGIWDRLVGAVELDIRTYEDFELGIVIGVTSLAKSTVQAVHAAWSLSPGRLGADPAGWHRTLRVDLAGAGALAGAVARDPLGVAKQVGEDLINAKTWATKPAEAAGELVPQVVSMIDGEGEEVAAVQVTEDAASAARDLELKTVANQIARGHAWEDHKIRRHDFPEISTPEELAEHAYSVMRTADPRALSADRSAYFDDKTGTLVIWDPNHRDGGSTYRPTRGRSYFDELF
ncbi:MAG: putative T7SS-secreted protein [Acidimicrobiales bacterium]